MTSSHPRWEVTLWAGAVVLGAVAAGRARGAEQGYQHVAAQRVVTPAPDAGLLADSARADSVVTALDALDARNPFARESQGVAAAGVGRVATAPALTPPRLPRPTLGLRGVVGVAPTLRAVVDGIPGAEGGVLLAAGDTVRGLRVRRVTPDTVVVQGADTVWHLTIRRTWP